MSKIVIGDIHGCYFTLAALVKQLPHNNIAFTGDLIDRGPRSMAVVNFIIKGGYDCVKGNHEQMMIDYEEEKEYFLDCWRTNGGIQTIDSYANNKDMFKDHLEWVKKLPTTIEYKDIKNDKGEHLLISHSMAFAPMLRPDLFDKEKKDHEVMWSRDFHKIKPIPNIYNMFGHTPQNNGPKIKSFYACVDTGACYNAERQVNAGYGVLTAVEYPSMKTWTQKNID